MFPPSVYKVKFYPPLLLMQFAGIFLQYPAYPKKIYRSFTGIDKTAISFAAMPKTMLFHAIERRGWKYGIHKRPGQPWPDNNSFACAYTSWDYLLYGNHTHNKNRRRLGGLWGHRRKLGYTDYWHNNSRSPARVCNPEIGTGARAPSKMFHMQPVPWLRSIKSIVNRKNIK